MKNIPSNSLTQPSRPSQVAYAALLVNMKFFTNIKLKPFKVVRRFHSSFFTRHGNRNNNSNDNNTQPSNWRTLEFLHSLGTGLMELLKEYDAFVENFLFFFLLNTLSCKLSAIDNVFCTRFFHSMQTAFVDEACSSVFVFYIYICEALEAKGGEKCGLVEARREFAIYSTLFF